MEEGQTGKTKEGKKKISKKDKLEKSVSWIIVIILISILIIVAIFFIRQKFFGPTFEYNGYEVTRVRPEGTTVTMYVLRTPVRIYASTQIYYSNLRYDPRELKDIPVEETTREVLLDPKPTQVYLTFDPDAEDKGHIALSMNEVARILGTSGLFLLPVSTGVTKEVEGLEEKKITCDNSNESVPVIDFRYGDETKIYVDETYWRCIVVQGKDKDEMVRSGNKLVLTILGI
ncbi:MAG: hypothetical protein KJ767_01835 [Nanoarchaeota archaeon]|nr:hypothetical protein [Nanoarchaeota archaeon]